MVIGEGNGNQFHSCLENPMNREVWWAIVHRVAESQDTIEATRHGGQFFGVSKSQ